MKVIVLGYGQIGRTIVRDLASTGYDVTVVDRYKHDLPSDLNVDYMVVDNMFGDFYNLIKPYDIIVGALPGSIGYKAVEHMAYTGKKCVDVSFMPENPLAIDQIAREHGSTILVDMGLAPGIPNILIGHACARMCRPTEATFYVGGSPARPFGPDKYFTTWSAEGVIQEYTMPARIVRNGWIEEKEPFSELHEVDWNFLPGTLEAFLTDGLRTLNYTRPAPNMKEYTMRWPGHAKLMMALDSMGFFDGAHLKNTAKVLEEHWSFRAKTQQHEDFVALAVFCLGRNEAGTDTVKTFTLLDTSDPQTGDTAMARTTGFTVTAGVEMLAEDGVIDKVGVHAPETIGQKSDVLHMLKMHLKMRGVEIE